MPLASGTLCTWSDCCSVFVLLFCEASQTPCLPIFCSSLPARHSQPPSCWLKPLQISKTPPTQPGKYEPFFLFTEPVLHTTCCCGRQHSKIPQKDRQFVGLISHGPSTPPRSGILAHDSDPRPSYSDCSFTRRMEASGCLSPAMPSLGCRHGLLAFTAPWN